MSDDIALLAVVAVALLALSGYLTSDDSVTGHPLDQQRELDQRVDLNLGRDDGTGYVGL